MDRAAALATRLGADLVMATDPDADRLGAMAPTPGGEFRFVNGNEIAAMLTHFKLQRLADQGELPRSPIVLATEVTTGQVTRIARHFKAQVVNDLLVGFKYHADVLWHLEKEGAYGDVRGTPDDFVIATEESHGILVTPHIRDKDAGGAALLLAELALNQKRHGRTLADYIDVLNRQFGYFRNEGVPVFMAGILGKTNMARILDSLRALPPTDVAGMAVTAFEDLRDENGRMGPLKGATDAAGRNFLIFRFGDRAKVVLRPSGTEPKAKAYIEACTAPWATGTSPEQWRRACQETDDLVRRLSLEFWRQALGRIGMGLAEAGIK
jgi:phosphoglucomutase/phosphomannomutase